MATAIVTRTETPTATHPGTAGFNANRCPSCGERCGDLIGGQCLGCHVGWNAGFQGAEEMVDHLCPACETEYPVLLAQHEGGAWVLAGDERCPRCDAEPNGDHPSEPGGFVLQQVG